MTRLLVALVRRPGLWPTAVKVVVRFWRPSRAFLAFRTSVYGAPLAEIPAVDLVRFLEWCRRFPGPVR